MKKLFLSLVVLSSVNAFGYQVHDVDKPDTKSQIVRVQELNISKEMKRACSGMFESLKLDGLCENVVAANSKITTQNLVGCLTTGHNGVQFQNIQVAGCLVNLVQQIR